MAEFQKNTFSTYYEMTGQGEPLLFLHGLGSSTQDWQVQVEGFSRHYRVICLDLRGHGKSSPLRSPYTIHQYAADVAALIEALNLGPVHLVGLSLGGIVGLQLAVDKPAVLRSLTVVNGFVELSMRSWKNRLEVFKRLLVIRLLGIDKMGGIIAKRLFPKDAHSRHRERFRENWQKNDQISYLYAFKSLLGWSVREQLAGLRLPILVVGAEFDYTSIEEKEAYVAQMPNAYLEIIKDSHHALPVEKPDEFNQVLQRFLGKL